MAGIDAHAAALSAAHQAAAVNGVRGLLWSEHATDPEVGAVMLECNLDGSVDVTVLSSNGTPIGGYSL